MSTETRIPAKKWRVRLTGGDWRGYRSKLAAYEGVSRMAPADLAAATVTVEHWGENGRWELYEKIEPRETALKAIREEIASRTAKETAR